MTRMVFLLRLLYSSFKLFLRQREILFFALLGSAAVLCPLVVLIAIGFLPHGPELLGPLAGLFGVGHQSGAAVDFTSPYTWGAVGMMFAFFFFAYISATSAQ